MELIPTHVGNLESVSLGKVENLSAKDAESLHPGRLLAGVEEELIAQTDAKIGTICVNPSFDHIPKSCLPELTRAVAERTHTGNHQCRTTRRVSLLEHMDAFCT
jgi:hypothetical protein